MNRIFVLVVIGVIILSSCSDSRQKDYNKIKALENEINTATFDMTKAKTLMDACVKYAEDYPKDTASVMLLFKAANIAMNIGKAKLSVELYDKIIKDYPSFSKVADCMFLKAFVYDEKLKDIIKARDAYKAFLEKYPTHEFAKDAKACLHNLGKTSEQLMKEFEEKQKADSIAAK